MQEVFEKIRNRIESLKTNLGFGGTIQQMYADGMLDRAIEIVNQVAEEFATDTNVGNSWEIVYDKVLKLEKEYAMSGDIENVNDCIRLENLLQYFKEELREEYNQSLTNDGWIPVSSGNFPKEGQVVNATILIESQQRRFVTQVMYGSWWLNSDKRMIAWKPLEEPYEGE